MSAENKYITNKESILGSVNDIKTVQIGIVVSIEDTQSMGRIKVKIPGPASRGGDDGSSIDDLPWSYPMIPKFFISTPKVGEGVFVMVFTDQKSHSDRLYFGPIISTLNNLNVDPVATTALNPFTFGIANPNTDFTRIPALNGIFPKIDDIAIQGRYNTDLLLRKNEILLRAGKFVEVPVNDNNPYPFQFNITTPAFIHIKNNVALEPPKDNQTQATGSVVNIVGNKINLLTHKDGSPRFNLADQDDQITDDELLNILANSHQLPFGDVLLQYLRLMKDAILGHYHNSSVATDIVTEGNKQPVAAFKKAAENLEAKMLSKNIRIN